MKSDIISKCVQTFSLNNNYLYHYWVSCSNASSKLRIEISAKGYSYLFKEVATTQNNKQTNKDENLTSSSNVLKQSSVDF